MAAVDVGSLVAIQWMLSKRVNLAVIDIDGTTVLLAALWREKADRLRVLELLLEHGAPVNLPGIYGMTPAHLAALNNDVDALRILIAHGADLTLKDCDGTPLDAAESRHAEAAAELIRRALDEGRGSEHS